MCFKDAIVHLVQIEEWRHRIHNNISGTFIFNEYPILMKTPISSADILKKHHNAFSNISAYVTKIVQ